MKTALLSIRKEWYPTQPTAPAGPIKKHFYFIWNPNALRPSVRYWTWERAKVQAETLRMQHPDEEFLVFHAFKTDL